MTALTTAQEKGIETLRANQPLSPREFAMLMWPDSPAWHKRTRKFGGRDPGAVGGTMPMNGARLLWRLFDLKLAYRDETGRWRAY
ncbi:MAG: hypothetical protein K0S70_104 [Microbacterium sp.]|jgi:hypothetical protein|nr:hypothetical protein [Microbacterium sp.]